MELFKILLIIIIGIVVLIVLFINLIEFKINFKDFFDGNSNDRENIC